MIIEIKKCELDDRNIKAVIALSKEWESEDLTYGYCANDKNDLIGNDLFLAYSDAQIIGYLFGKCSVLNEAITPIDKGSKCFDINEIYDYPRSFKDINDIDKILGIFEMEKY